MNALLVGLGGFVGSVARFGVNGLAQRWFAGSQIPLGTLLVNLAGCLLVGFVTKLGEAGGGLTAGTRALVVVGILGGFTTFSAFGNETMTALRTGHAAAGLANAGAQVIGGLACVALGRALASWLTT